jgi:hypothetical protein
MSSYYERNREKILKKNKLRYKTDPEFRQSKINATNKYRRKVSSLKKKFKTEKKLKEKYWAVLEVQGKVQECCDIRFLSGVLNREVQTIRRWERHGNFPKTFMFKSRRFYTKKHFLMIKKYWEEYGEKNLELFFKNVTKYWNKCYK